jgi:hypothetical protein
MTAITLARRALTWAKDHATLLAVGALLVAAGVIVFLSRRVTYLRSLTVALEGQREALRRTWHATRDARDTAEAQRRTERAARDEELRQGREDERAASDERGAEIADELDEIEKRMERRRDADMRCKGCGDVLLPTTNQPCPAMMQACEPAIGRAAVEERRKAREEG